MIIGDCSVKATERLVSRKATNKELRNALVPWNSFLETGQYPEFPSAPSKCFSWWDCKKIYSSRDGRISFAQAAIQNLQRITHFLSQSLLKMACKFLFKYRGQVSLYWVILLYSSVKEMSWAFKNLKIFLKNLEISSKKAIRTLILKHCKQTNRPDWLAIRFRN